MQETFNTLFKKVLSSNYYIENGLLSNGPCDCRQTNDNSNEDDKYERMRTKCRVIKKDTWNFLYASFFLSLEASRVREMHPHYKYNYKRFFLSL